VISFNSLQQFADRERHIANLTAVSGLTPEDARQLLVTFESNFHTPETSGEAARALITAYGVSGGTSETAERTYKDMMTAQDVELLKALRQKKLDALKARKEAIIAAFGDDGFQDGAVVTWVKTFEQEGKKYTYVALKGGEQWYVTGKARAMTWEELLVEIVSGPFPADKVDLMVKYGADKATIAIAKDQVIQ
jgi:hypothetical protein